MRVPVVFLLYLSCINSYNILVYIPKFAISHIHFMGKLADTLVDAGHNVTALISEMDANLPDGTKKARILRISPAEGADHMTTQFEMEDTDIFDMDFESYTAITDNARANAVSFCRQCRKLLTTPGLVERLKNDQFDAFIMENFDNCGVGLSHIISPKALIPVSSSSIFGIEDLGAYPSLVTDHHPFSDGKLHYTSVWARLKNFYTWFLVKTFYDIQNGPLQQIFDELYPGTPTFSEIIANAAVIFPNTEPLIDYAKATISKIVPIGGITVGEPKPLNEYWSALMTLRPRTVLVSFGSICKSVLMKHSRKTAILEAFSSFPDTTFIWKYENSSDSFSTLEAANVPNVVLTEWMPQLDILADSRLNLFISHAGMASCHEIAKFGVPSLLVPIFGDQIQNAGALANAGVAEVFDKFDMSDAKKLQNAVGKMLSDPTYKEEASRIRNQIASQPSSPAERLVKNVEFAARFGPSKSLKPLALELSTIQLYGIDLALILFAAIIVLIILLSSALRFARRIISSIRIQKVQKEE
ncbi:hypothetical protein PFISCL1PPCAC_4819 [Pristionchus fissidentatus]|uniref:glucuronosyltransferase n=1 Tax=Pristionchus fissidentatus TaxID=1538716 RepID=A0AAV5V1R9_9BILA|nr:hypothetical protein PFISCL1PPCAC_4819 [Pristionchus fissidentatus]